MLACLPHPDLGKAYLSSPRILAALHGRGYGMTCIFRGGANRMHISFQPHTAAHHEVVEKIYIQVEAVSLL